jgi:micrococcal nuclease
MISISDGRKIAAYILLISFLILPSIAAAAPDEAYGMVTNVADGDTFDVVIEKAAPKINYSVERIRLADVDSPEMNTEEGQDARDFTYAVLMNKKVYLDIDDLSENGRDSYGRLICLVYLAGVYGQPIIVPNFNRLLVESGHARMKNFTNNEFSPQDWESGKSIPSHDDEELDIGQRLQQNITEEILPQVQESAEMILDRAVRDFWMWLKGQIGLDRAGN